LFVPKHSKALKEQSDLTTLLKQKRQESRIMREDLTRVRVTRSLKKHALDAEAKRNVSQVARRRTPAAAIEGLTGCSRRKVGQSGKARHAAHWPKMRDPKHQTIQFVRGLRSLHVHCDMRPDGDLRPKPRLPLPRAKSANDKLNPRTTASQGPLQKQRQVGENRQRPAKKSFEYHGRGIAEERTGCLEWTESTLLMRLVLSVGRLAQDIGRSLHKE